MLSVATLWVFRLGQYSHRGRGPLAALARLVHGPLDLVYVKLLIGADLPPSVSCGPRLALPHGGRGVFIHPLATIGADVTIAQQVTIGNVRGEPAAPRIGVGVTIGVKASVLGAVSVGDRSIVGAHAAVTKDVPAGMVAVGIPAQVSPRH